MEGRDETILGPADAAYPRSLREIADPPTRLHVRGDRAALVDGLLASIAIVGARDATPYGEKVARDLARDLAVAGVVVVSGLARGIDAAAHAGCLQAGGRTVAVVGAGTDQPYPRENERLRAEILARGLVLGEHPPGTPPLARHFPRRNRIISGICQGVVVVEAALRSGSLVTARLARDQGRVVFAVPGPVDHPRSRGPHALLREGARLVESVRDIFDEVPWLAGAASSRAGDRPEVAGGVGDAAGAILQVLARGPAPLDDLSIQTGRSVQEVWASLLELEIRGTVVRGPGGRFRRAPEGAAGPREETGARGGGS